jgi:hypothetical protein
VDVVDPPAGFEMDEVERERFLFVEVLEMDMAGRLVAAKLIDRDVEALDIPFLGIDEGIAIERRHLVLLF